MADPQTFDTLIRGKGIFDGCKSVREMADRADKMAKELKRMAEAGVTLRDEVADDYAFLETDDPQVAQRFEFDESEEDDDEDDG